MKVMFSYSLFTGLISILFLGETVILRQWLLNLDDYQNQPESLIKIQISGLHPELLTLNLRGIWGRNLQMETVRIELNSRMPSWCLKELLGWGWGCWVSIHLMTRSIRTKVLSVNSKRETHRTSEFILYSCTQLKTRDNHFHFSPWISL